MRHGYFTDGLCDYCGGDEFDCECETETTTDALTVSVTFPDCGHTLSLLTGQRLPARCPACSQGILPGQTHCEDYPCCGHTGRDSGCMPKPEHTSEYWSRLSERMDPDVYDSYCDVIDRQEWGY